MTPKIVLNKDRQIEIITYIKFGKVSDSELDLLGCLVHFSEGLLVELSKDLSAEIEGLSGLNSAAISTTLHRLGRKGIITKQGRNIRIHPAYKAADYSDLLLSFTPLN